MHLHNLLRFDVICLTSCYQYNSLRAEVDSKRGLWLEHAIVLQALLPVLADFPLDNNSNSRLKIIVLSGDSTSSYGVVVEVDICNLEVHFFQIF